MNGFVSAGPQCHAKLCSVRKLVLKELRCLLTALGMPADCLHLHLLKLCSEADAHIQLKTCIARGARLAVGMWWQEENWLPGLQQETVEKPVWRLAFFSRLEERKGLKLFVRAVDALQEAALEAEARFEVFFIGSDARIDMQPSTQWLRAVTASWKCVLQTLEDLHVVL